MSKMQQNPSPEFAQETAETTPETKKTNKPAKEKKPLWREIVEWIVTIVAALAVAFLIRTFLFEPVRVDGHSMDFTLADGEVMIVTKPDYLLGTPQRFDVIICHYPNRTMPGLFGIETPINFVKRIVGLPGDVMEINNGSLYVNGEMYEEPYITNRPNYIMKPYTVPEGMYFVLGDNRSNSNDSHIIGPISRDMIVGHVQTIVWPLNAIRTIPNGLDVKDTPHK